MENVALQTSPSVTTQISDCYFDSQQSAVILQGDAVVSGCVFAGDDDGSWVQVQNNVDPFNLLVTDCRFQSDNYAALAFSLGSSGSDIEVRDCVFAGATLAFRSTAQDRGTFRSTDAYLKAEIGASTPTSTHS